MPYVVRQDQRCPQGEPWGVVNPDTGQLHGCHATKKQARQQQSALYVNVPDAAAAAGDVTVPALVTLPGVDVVAAGTWNLSTGTTTFTTEDLAAAVEAAQCPAVGPPLIKVGHADPRFDGEPAVGRVLNMALTAEGNKITGDLAGMPGWLGVIAESAYPSRSVEGRWDFRCQTGHTHPFVITGLALLGVQPPGVGVLGGLESVAALYGVAASSADASRVFTATGGPMTDVSAGVSTEDVRRAYYGAGTPLSMWITEMQMDPPQLIVADEASDKVYRVPFKIRAGTVSFDDPQEVQVEYVDVAAARGHGGVIVAFASAAESRAVIAAWDSSAAVKNMGDDPSAAAIRKMFALPADSKTDSKLPHHDCTAAGAVGAANPDGCSAAIGALNGARGGLAGVSSADKQTAYNHLAAHLRQAGQEPPEFTGSAPDDADAAGVHAAHDGEHSHPHAAYGTQGSDQTHDHPHVHAGDNNHAHEHAPAASSGPTERNEAATMGFTDEQAAAIRAKLRLAADAELTEDTLAAAITALEEPGKVAAGALPKGIVAIDETTLEDLRSQAAKGDQALQKIRNSERDTVLAGAIKEGRIPASRRQLYAELWDSDPERTRVVIASMARNSVPVSDIGSALGLEDDDDEVYAAVFGRPGK